MSKQPNYRQCVLHKPGPDGFTSITSWLPERYAEAGRELSLRDTAGQWDSGWVVQSVSASSLPENCLPDSHKDIKSHLRATGDSLPKHQARSPS